MTAAKMWLKILCLVIIAGKAAAADDFLSHLYGLEQRNKAFLCLKPTATRQGRNCSGALLHDQWIGVRAGCLRQHPLDHIIALRPQFSEVTCDDVIHGLRSRYSRIVRSVFYHPWADLAIAHVDGPYFDLDMHPNSTKWTIPRMFKNHGTWKWMKKYINEFALERDPYRYYIKLERTMIANRSPLLVMLLAIILPVLLLLSVFYYDMSRGSSSEIAYKNLDSTKKASQV